MTKLRIFDNWGRFSLRDLVQGGFPIGLHVILQIQIKKFENDCYVMWKIILTENPSRFNVEPLLK